MSGDSHVYALKIASTLRADLLELFAEHKRFVHAVLKLDSVERITTLLLPLSRKQKGSQLIPKEQADWKPRNSVGVR
jgi:hypothetical protein